MSLSFKIERLNRDQPSLGKAHSSRRPTNHLDSSDDEDPDGLSQRSHSKKRDIEFISDFDSSRAPSNGHQRSEEISIPALPDRDFRAVHLARKQKRAKKELYKPDQINSMGGTSKITNDEIVDLEGLDKMNSKPIEGGLKPPTSTKSNKIEPSPPTIESSVQEPSPNSPSAVAEANEPQTIEERAAKELLSQAKDSQLNERPTIDVIHIANDSRQHLDTDSDDSGDETEQFRRDVAKRPDSSTLEDYERIPVGQFGMALLKGMGWKEGTAATKKGRVGLVEAYVPQARPSLLGIGAKPLVLDSDATASNKNKFVKPNKKYVPLLRKVIDDDGKQRSSTQSPSSTDRRSKDSPRDTNGRDSDYHSSSSHRESRDRQSHHCDYQRDHRRGDREHSRHQNYSDDDRDHKRSSHSHRKSPPSSSRHDYRSSSSSYRHDSGRHESKRDESRRDERSSSRSIRRAY